MGRWRSGRSCATGPMCRERANIDRQAQYLLLGKLITEGAHQRMRAVINLIYNGHFRLRHLPGQAAEIRNERQSLADDTARAVWTVTCGAILAEHFRRLLKTGFSAIRNRGSLERAYIQNHIPAIFARKLARE